MSEEKARGSATGSYAALCVALVVVVAAVLWSNGWGWRSSLESSSAPSQSNLSTPHSSSPQPADPQLVLAGESPVERVRQKMDGEKSRIQIYSHPERKGHTATEGMIRLFSPDGLAWEGDVERFEALAPGFPENVVGAQYSGSQGNSAGSHAEYLAGRLSLDFWMYPGLLVDARADPHFHIYHFEDDYSNVYPSWKPASVASARVVATVGDTGLTYLSRDSMEPPQGSLWGRSENSIWLPIAGKQRTDGTLVMTVSAICSGSIYLSLVGEELGVAFQTVVILDESGDVNRVLEIRPGSPAEIVGVQPGDYLIHVGMGNAREARSLPQATLEVEVRCGQVADAGVLLPRAPRAEQFVYGQATYSQLALLEGVVDRGAIKYKLIPHDNNLRASGTSGWSKLAGIHDQAGEDVDSFSLGPFPEGSYTFEVQPLNIYRSVSLHNADLDLGTIEVDLARVVVDLDGSVLGTKGLTSVIVNWIDGEGKMHPAPVAVHEDGSRSAICPPGQVQVRAGLADGRVYRQTFSVHSGWNAVSVVARAQSVYTLGLRVDGVPLEKDLDWWFRIKVSGGGAGCTFLGMGPKELVMDVEAMYSEIQMSFEGSGSFDIELPAIDDVTDAITRPLLIKEGVVESVYWEL